MSFTGKESRKLIETLTHQMAKDIKSWDGKDPCALLDTLSRKMDMADTILDATEKPKRRPVKKKIAVVSDAVVGGSSPGTSSAFSAGSNPIPKKRKHV